MATRRCLHCGAPNTRWRETCAACDEPLPPPLMDDDAGATRPFIPTGSLPEGDEDLQPTEAFQPASEPPQWSTTAQDNPGWVAAPAWDEVREPTLLSPPPAPAPRSPGVALGCIALFLIGIVAAAVLWLTYVGPTIPDVLTP
jgi:hypothetical protein